MAAPARDFQPDISRDELRALLAARAEELARAVFPAGRRDGRHWRVGSLYGEPGQSLAIELSGERAGAWRDFSTDERGDAWDLVAKALCHGDRREAYHWLRDFLGLPVLDMGSAGAHATARRAGLAGGGGPGRNDAAIAAAKAKAEQAKAEEAARAEKKARAAKAIWLSARPLIPGDPVWQYLGGRGIDLARLPRLPAALRYHPELFYSRAAPTAAPPTPSSPRRSDGGEYLPGMVASMTTGDGAGAIHRTFLRPSPSLPSPASGGGGTEDRRGGSPANPPGPVEYTKLDKRMLGGSGIVPLSRGEDGRALKAGADTSIIIAEGIETALSLAVVRPDLRVIATCTAGNFPICANLLPPRFGREGGEIILAADNDGEDAASEAHVAELFWTLTDQGRVVRLIQPADAGTDFNDVLRAEALHA